ncbi:hypothetical protein Cni_G05625 [Canna indica]|uniref:Zinc finger protein CONSTANS-LIKE 16 n=1 Tax=Canna indica TaxID=4628 RepID=A0AAQ3JXG8_9LILI|nr:hypothetical protein Cni_G05625 [Canna indica]
MSYSEEQQRSAGAVAARTARACESCLRRSARWFCEADDAFLCQACDISVHSANPLALRHHRVRLKTVSSSFAPAIDGDSDEHSMPAWLHGLTRKPRTPRGKPGLAAGAIAASKVESLVPDFEDLSSEENLQPSEEEQLLHCVPILDAGVLSEFSSQPQLDDADSSGAEVIKLAVQLPEYDRVPAVDTPDALAGFHLTTDLDLAAFASDMETLLGSGLDHDDDDGLSLVNELVEDEDKGQVKSEMGLNMNCGDVGCDFRIESALSKETAPDLDNFDCCTPMMEVEIEEHKDKLPLQQEAAAKTKTILKLDYEAVIAAWSSDGGSPWADGERPQFDPSVDRWADFTEILNLGGGGGGKRGLVGMGARTTVDEGREARVSRYRKKRRTRLFSKKIRYEVRKLNAEKRPRMKGRFVKRAAPFPLAAAAATLTHI